LQMAKLACMQSFGLCCNGSSGAAQAEAGMYGAVCCKEEEV
jgi:hypothetical protein